MKYFIIAGEASGDLHGSNLMKQIQQLDPQAQFLGFGGDRMISNGLTAIKHIKDLAFMGFIEVVKNLSTIKKNLRLCESEIIKFQPDAVIFIDYPGFNLRIAKAIRELKARKFYYISPTVWAWKKSRIQIIRNYIDKLYVILPFEKDFYLENNYNAEFLGHPLLDAISVKKKAKTSKKFIENNKLSEKPIVALLPGSRHQELSKMLPVMLQVAERFSDYQYVIAGAPGLQHDDYRRYLANSDIQLVFDQTYTLLENSLAAIVTSGTATLETAIYGVPELVCYKTSKINFLIAKALVNVKYISLVNLIMDQEIVREFIQTDCTVDNLSRELEKLLFDELYRKEMKVHFGDLYKRLGGPGTSGRIAASILNSLQKVSSI